MNCVSRGFNFRFLFVLSFLYLEFLLLPGGVIFSFSKNKGRESRQFFPHPTPHITVYTKVVRNIFHIGVIVRWPLLVVGKSRKSISAHSNLLNIMPLEWDWHRPIWVGNQYYTEVPELYSIHQILVDYYRTVLFSILY